MKLAIDRQSTLHQNRGILLLALFHVIGMLGIMIGPIPWILNLTPLNLLVATTIILLFHQQWNSSTILFITICYLTGFLFEVAGVNTGNIFGDYSYGPVLGWQIWNTPLIIGANWLLLIYSSSALVNLIFPKFSPYLRALIAAVLMVSLDIIIEPVAISLNFWNWSDPVVPLQNYVAWFLISWGLTTLFQFCFKNAKNKVGASLFIIQIIFFSCLWFVLA